MDNKNNETDTGDTLIVRLKYVTNSRLQLSTADIIEVFSEWLSDNSFSIVNDDMEIIEI